MLVPSREGSFLRNRRPFSWRQGRCPGSTALRAAQFAGRGRRRVLSRILVWERRSVQPFTDGLLNDWPDNRSLDSETQMEAAVRRLGHSSRASERVQPDPPPEIRRKYRPSLPRWKTCLSSKTQGIPAKSAAAPHWRTLDAKLRTAASDICIELFGSRPKLNPKSRP